MKIILTEEQVKRIISEEVAAQEITNQLSDETNPNTILNTLATAIKSGGLSPLTLPFILKNLLTQNPQGEQQRQGILQRLRNLFGNNNQQDTENMEDKQQENPDGTWKNKLGNWKTVSNDTIATVYNAVPAQCNKDVVHTASMFKLNLSDVLSQRVIAMERTYRAKLGLKYGDIVYIEGTGKWDGPWQIQDTMNKRFAGLPKIDILVPNNITTGMWHNVKLSIPTDEQTKMNAKGLMRGSA